MSDNATNAKHTHYQEDDPSDPNEEREHWQRLNQSYRDVNGEDCP